MLEIDWLALLMVGLLGGGHCVGMCGGIVGALSLGLAPGRSRWPLLLGYNLGRIASYGLIGALLGLLAGSGVSLLNSRPFQLGLFALANVMLVLLGLYLAGWSQQVTRIEQLGRPLWRRLQPLGQRFLPVKSPGQALLIGAIWGWLPCGLVYSASLSALASANPVQGAGLMLAFGLGTLPNLLLMGAFASSLRKALQRVWVRRVAGALVAALGLWRLFGLLAN